MKDKQIKGFKNACMYFDSLVSRFPLKFCLICGQPVKTGRGKIILTEFKIDRRTKYYNRKTKSKTLEVFHIKCKNKLLKKLRE